LLPVDTLFVRLESPPRVQERSTPKFLRLPDLKTNSSPSPQTRHQVMALFSLFDYPPNERVERDEPKLDFALAGRFLTVFLAVCAIVCVVPVDLLNAEVFL